MFWSAMVYFYPWNKIRSVSQNFLILRPFISIFLSVKILFGLLETFKENESNLSIGFYVMRLPKNTISFIDI